MASPAAYGLRVRLLSTASVVLVAEIFGYTGTRKPHAMDMDWIILATASSIEYLVWCVGGLGRLMPCGTPRIAAISRLTLYHIKRPPSPGFAPCPYLISMAQGSSFICGRLWMISSQPK